MSADGNAYAEPEGSYLAATAATNRNDWAAVEFDYLDFYGGTRHTAQAAVSLTVLYGYRDLSMTGFEEVPLMTECTFSASSTLNGQPRAGTQYDWTVDGEPRGDSAVAVLRLDAEGFYDVTVRATDEFGHVLTNSRWVHAYNGSQPCS